MYKIRVPATSANLGSGFDALGVSLGLYNFVYMDEYDCIDISSKDGSVFDTSENNLVYKSAKEIFSLYGHNLKGLRMFQENNIPMTRGLGSSSACIVAGITGANAILGNPLSRDDLINIAAKIEGHPDNTTPAILGGFVASVMDSGKTYSVKVPLENKVDFAAFIPPFELSTEKARACLPNEYSKKDVVHNLSRAALMSISLLAGKFENLKVSVDDKIHQPYRLPLIPGADEIFRISEEFGAHATYISGAGPTIMSIIRPDDINFIEKSQKFLNKNLPDWKLLILKSDDDGVFCEKLK